MGKVTVNKIILLEEDIRRLNLIRSYIIENLDKDLSIPDLSGQFNIGNSTLRRHFSFNYQQSISVFILECRMTKAMSLIMNRETSIKKVARSTGYNRQSTFTHAFRKYFGHPPKYYVKISKTLRERIKQL